MGLKEAGKVREMSCGGNFAYIIQDNNDFLATEYKVLKNQNEKGFVKCVRLMHNGKIELYYLTENYRSFSSMLTSIDGEGFMTIVMNLFTSVLEVKNNGFLACQGIDISIDKIFVNPSNYTIGLIYIPTRSRAFDSYETFENELRTSLVKLISNMPTISSQKIITLSMDLIDGTQDLEALVNKSKGMVHMKQSVQAAHSMQPASAMQKMPAMQQESGLLLIAPSYDLTLCVDKDEYVIGKYPSGDGVIGFNKAISRQHCRISHTMGNYFVEDLRSSNGTYLNQRRLEPNQPAKLADGDILRLADLDLQVKLGERRGR